ncbi:universal stress protein [Nordella sp. HKS 07]|uniref:universal stress protein n=1 Tax=Nordella sp. HKS 07 TaxID=2712222 RepID=UPI0013E1B954|nr:universal stress protein [Nordella sp. HKS 07]QIG48368.1 universal stress protein [Nordella sp. HKS 07]
MAYKTILASLNEVSQVRTVLSATATIARNEMAHVIGLYVIPAIELQVGSEIQVVPVENDELQKYFKQQEKAVKAAFESMILEDGIEGEFRVIEASEPYIAATITEESREADLVIVGYSSSVSSRALGADFSERLVIGSGRPTLVVPRDGHRGFAHDRILVGWNGSREAARAIFDGVPLLQRADEVLVAIVGTELEHRLRAETRREGLVRTLLRHGVHARAIDLDSSREAGKVLLERAETRDVGLIVMGAYGHARLREFILGGATRSVLKGMRCPVLFSH